MTELKIDSSKLRGFVHIPSSKSLGHREIICAGLAEGISIVDNISMSDDIKATCSCLTALGVKFKYIESQIPGRTALSIEGCGGNLKVVRDKLDCHESGSTLRFMVPFAVLCNKKITFKGSGKLVDRPIKPYLDIFDEKAIQYEKPDGLTLPLKVKGRLTAGEYELPGDVSSQFITGLLFALTLLKDDSIIRITTKLESKSYIDLTLDSLKKYGVHIEHEDYMVYKIKGGQKYKPCNTLVEGDFSQIAYWLVAGTFAGPISARGMNPNTKQGDRAIIDIMKKMGAKIITEKEGKVFSFKSDTHSTVIDAADCPDIIPPLAVLAAVSEGTTEVINAGRLRIKECDRLAALTKELSRVGADIEELENGLIIRGKKELAGGEFVECWNDHRIAMSMGIAALKCQKPIVLRGTECVSKSYPSFWEDFVSLGAKIKEV